MSSDGTIPETYRTWNIPTKFESLMNRHNDHLRNLNLIKLNINEYELKNSQNLDVTINNQEIVDYFNQNIDSYMNPEKRDIKQ